MIISLLRVPSLVPAIPYRLFIPPLPPHNVYPDDIPDTYSGSASNSVVSSLEWGCSYFLKPGTSKDEEALVAGRRIMKMIISNRAALSD